MNLSFVLCNFNHLDALVDISRSTFINAFEKDNNPTDFHNHVNTALSKTTLGNELKNPNMSFYFLFLDDLLVGYFKLNENDAQVENFNLPTIELERIYVKAEFQGKKLGELMLKHAIDISKEKKAAFLWLGVWEKNINAIRFYERMGFEFFGSHDFYVGTDKQKDLLMKLILK